MLPGFHVSREKPCVSKERADYSRCRCPALRSALLLCLHPERSFGSPPTDSAGISHLVFCKKAHPSIFLKRLSKLIDHIFTDFIAILTDRDQWLHKALKDLSEIPQSSSSPSLFRSFLQYLSSRNEIIPQLYVPDL